VSTPVVLKWRPLDLLREEFLFIGGIWFQGVIGEEKLWMKNLDILLFVHSTHKNSTTRLV